MPFNFGQLFTENPYENQFNPETGIRKKPSLIQRLAYPQEADRVSLENYQQNVLAGTDKSLAPNPALGLREEGDAGFVDASGNVADLATEKIARKAGVTNPFLRPSAATAFFHPETMKMWNQFQNAPAENQLEVDRQAALSPQRLAENSANRTNIWKEAQSHWQTQEEQRQQSARNDIPINVDQAAATHAAIQKEKSKQATSEIIALQRTPIWASMSEWIKQMSPEDAGIAIGGDARLSNILAQSMAAAGLKSNMIEISAAQQKAEAELKTAQAQKDLEDLDLKHRNERAKLTGSTETLERFNAGGGPTKLADQELFRATTGVDQGNAATTSHYTMLNPDGTATLRVNPQSYDPLQFERDRQMKSFSAKNAMASGIGIVPEQGAPVRYFGEQGQGWQGPPAPASAAPPIARPVTIAAPQLPVTTIEDLDRAALDEAEDPQQKLSKAAARESAEGSIVRRISAKNVLESDINKLNFRLKRLLEEANLTHTDSNPIARQAQAHSLIKRIAELKKQAAVYQPGYYE